VRGKLALACRILADEGHARTLTGQITARAESHETFWTTRFDVGFSETTTSSLLRVSGAMSVLQGEGMPNPALRLHLGIYNAHPELVCIVHTCPPHCSALSMVGETLRVAHMDAMMFYENCVQLDRWPGGAPANEEGRLICEALRDKRSMLLAHRGLLTTGKTLEEAVYLAVLLEQAAQLHMLAHAVGSVRAMRPSAARQAREFLLKDSTIAATFNYWARCAARKYPEALG
jgi:L-fuculose-phosphate aldolase